MGNITIVTAFYDIGRGDWTPDKGLPHYLERSTETYIERFSHLAQLENEIIVFSTPDIIEVLEELNTKGNIKFIDSNILNTFSAMREIIRGVQQSKEFQDKINPSQRLNPEYWNPDYVLINLLKSTFVSSAIIRKLVNTDLVAWLDFGYCRTADKIPESKKWSYDFDPNKMHLFNYMDYDGRDIDEIIANNIVYILGAKVVGGQNAWREFNHLMNEQAISLINRGMIDDDQTVMLLSTIANPELFELHKIPDHQKGLDPFVIFQDFNTEAK